MACGVWRVACGGRVFESQPILLLGAFVMLMGGRGVGAVRYKCGGTSGLDVRLKSERYLSIVGLGVYKELGRIRWFSRT